MFKFFLKGTAATVGALTGTGAVIGGGIGARTGYEYNGAKGVLKGAAKGALYGVAMVPFVLSGKIQRITPESDSDLNSSSKP